MNASELMRFVKERCEIGPDARGRKKAVYFAYLDWHRETGQPTEAMGETVFGKAVSQTLGTDTHRTRRGNYFVGLGLKS